MKAWAITTKDGEVWMDDLGRFAIFETKKDALFEKKRSEFNNEAFVNPIVIRSAPLKAQSVEEKSKE